MKLKVRLYGTLSRRFPDYRQGEEMDVEVPEQGTAKDLLSVLKISESLGAVVAAEGRILKADDKVRAGSAVVVFQAIHGG
jgi:sulfur carrier protein ThiS